MPRRSLYFVFHFFPREKRVQIRIRYPGDLAQRFLGEKRLMAGEDYVRLGQKQRKRVVAMLPERSSKKRSLSSS